MFKWIWKLMRVSFPFPDRHRLFAVWPVPNWWFNVWLICMFMFVYVYIINLIPNHMIYWLNKGFTVNDFCNINTHMFKWIWKLMRVSFPFPDRHRLFAMWPVPNWWRHSRLKSCLNGLRMILKVPSMYHLLAFCNIWSWVGEPNILIIYTYTNMNIQINHTLKQT
jgi:hypothetical protein